MKKINLKLKYISILSYIYILLPIILFFINWLKLSIGISASIIVILGLIWIIKKDILTNENQIELPINALIISFIFIAIWVIYSGLGGFFFQTWDNHSRNAIFRDLINYSWPVIYPETNNALVYYFNFWLVPALFGKVGGWLVGNLALYLWGLFGIFLIFINILFYIKPRKKWHIFLITVFLIAWSGENYIGIVISNIFHICNNAIGFGSAEGWLDFSRNGYDCSYLYRSNIDALCQVYNQAIVPWLVVSMVLNNPKTRTFAYIGLCALCCGPIPFIGLLPIFLCYFIKEIILPLKMHKFLFIMREIFSIANISACITIFPVMWYFFKANMSFSGSDMQRGYVELFVPWEAFDIQRIMTLLLFYFLEFGIYMIFIWKKYKRDSLFWTILITLMIIPIFKIGAGRDFCMNASLPALFVLMIYTVNYFICEFKDKYTFKETLNFITLIIVLCISTTTLIGDCINKSLWMRNNNIFPFVADNTVTFASSNIEDLGDSFCINYLTSSPETKFFFKKLAKRKSQSAVKADLIKTKEYRDSSGLPLSGGYYVISPKQDISICLGTNGTEVFLEKDKNILLQALPEGKYRIRFIEYQVALDVPGGVVDENGKIWGFEEIFNSVAQRFVLEKEGEYYMICYEDYALTYDIQNNKIFMSHKSGSDNQLWTIIK